MKKSQFGALIGIAALALSACSSQSAAETELEGVKASGEPIVIGAQAPTKGGAAYPQTGFGLEAGVKYVNEVLGGIGGRPIELDICAGDGSPETAINCANGFVSKGVPLVIDAYDQSIGAAIPILGAANIPVVGTLSGGAIADQAEYGKTFYLTGPTEVSAVGSMSVLDGLGKTKVALAVNETPSSHTYVDTLIKPIAGALGMSMEAQYPPASGANFNVVAATQLSDDPDATGVISLPEDACTGLFQALRQQGYRGTIFAGSCSQFIDTMGPQAAGAIVQPRLWVPLSKDAAPQEVQEQLDDYTAAMDAVGRGEELSARSLYSFAGVVNVANILTAAGGDITAASVTEAMKNVKDFPTFAGPTVTCDGQQWPGIESACSKQAIFFEVQEDGTLAPVNEGGYTELDPSLVPAA
ncbi:ABC transporter substrate-binding protein [Rhodococcoides fascians]|uniref:ABC transporter substrate-binding protein n=1 Tax=Rhodococcoides fascians TaxID=1828 RepID=UPI00068E01E1|nr:ABC transporter substrate-binding protein [Rhodococcus fascians]